MSDYDNITDIRGTLSPGGPELAPAPHDDTEHAPSLHSTPDIPRIPELNPRSLDRTAPFIVDGSISRTISLMLLGLLSFDSIKVGDALISNSFSGTELEELYCILDTNLKRLQARFSVREDGTYEPEIERIYTALDEIMLLCTQNGFEAGCRFGGEMAK